MGSVIHPVTLKLGIMIYSVTLKLGSVIFSATLKLVNVIYHDTQDLSLYAEIPVTVQQIICRGDAKISGGGLVLKKLSGLSILRVYLNMDYIDVSQNLVWNLNIQAKQMGILMFVDS